MQVAGGKWTPYVEDGEKLEDLSLNNWVNQALGDAAICWQDITGCGEFDSVQAKKIADGLMAHINKVIDGVIAGTTQAVKHNLAECEAAVQTAYGISLPSPDNQLVHRSADETSDDRRVVQALIGEETRG
jgi:hypothetical protein